MSVEPKFYVDLPRDSAWDLPGMPTVIKANLLKGLLHVLEPEDFAKEWPTLRASDYIECSGPARELAAREYIVLVHELRPDINLPRWLTAQKIREWGLGNSTDKI